MRISLFSIFSLVLLVPATGLAVEPINEVHAMFYYQVPFSAGKAEQNKSSFGFRMDRTSYERGGMIQYQKLMQQTAVFDFKMGREGIQGLYISGVDFLQQYRLNKAAEGENDEAAGSAGADEHGKSDNAVKKVGRDISDTVKYVIDTVPLGFMIGGALGIALLANAGN